MKYITVYSRLLPLGRKMRSMAMWPFVIVKRSKRDEFSDRVRRHEEIHLRQQLELWLVGFYVLYGWYYVKGRFKYRSHEVAYGNNPFEREAYTYDYLATYLEQRQRFAWRAFL